MSTVNAGRVELDLVAIAKDQVSATLREINGNLKKTKAEMDETAGANRRLNASTEALSKGVREGVKPLNNMREGFENIRSNGLFLVSAITAVGGALVGLVKHLVEAGTAQGELNARAEEFGKAGDDMQRAIEALRDKLGQMGDKTREAFEKGTIAASEMRLKLDLTDEAMGNAAVKAQRLRYEWETFEKDRFGGGILDDRVAKANAVERAERRVLELANERRVLASKIADFEKLTLEYLQQQNIEVGKQILARTVPGLGLALSVGADKAAGQTPTPRGGGGGMSQGQVDAGWREKVRGASENKMSESESRALVRRLRRVAGGDEMDAADAAAEQSRLEMAEAMAEKHAEFLDGLAEEKRRVEDLAESYRGLGDVFADVLSPSYNNFVNSLSETFAAMALIEDSNERGVFGAGKLAKATFDLAAAESETAAGRFAWKAAGEAAEAIAAAARYDFWAAGTHGAAAVAFGIAAATAGGGGKSASGANAGGGSGPSSLDRGGNSNGGGTVIYNIDVKPGTDPQAVVRALRQTEHAARNTGPMNPGV